MSEESWEVATVRPEYLRDRNNCYSVAEVHAGKLRDVLRTFLDSFGAWKVGTTVMLAVRRAPSADSAPWGYIAASRHAVEWTFRQAAPRG